MPEFLLDDQGHLHLVLDYLGHELEPSILIGGWATFFRVGGDISYDIDLIIASPEVRSKISGAVTGVSESNNLRGRKWRGEVEGMHVDVYLPHESELGSKLRLRVEVLAEHTDTLGHGKWRLLTIEAHTVSKFAALLDRPDTEKGFKDAREIARLLQAGVDARTASGVLVAATAGPPEDLAGHVDNAFGLLGPRAELNKQQRRWLRGLRREWVTATQDALAPRTRQRPTLE